MLKHAIYRSRVLLFCAGVSLFSASSLSHAAMTCKDLIPLPPPPGTNSAKFVERENDTPERTSWVRDQNSKMNQALKESPNTKPISEWLRKVGDVPSTIKPTVLDETRTIYLKSQGLGKSQDLILKTSEGEQVLISSFDKKGDRDGSFRRNGDVHFVDFSLSTDHRYVAVVYERRGSTDEFEFIVYDIETQQTLRTEAPVIASDSKTYWLGSKLYFEKDKKLYSWDLKNRNDGPAQSGWGFIVDKARGVLLVKTMRGYSIATQSGEFELITAGRPKSILGFDQKFLYVRVQTGIDANAIVKIPFPLKGELHAETVAYFSDSVTQSMRYKEEFFHVKETMGPRQTWSVLSKDGVNLATVEAPEGTSITNVVVSADRTSLSVKLVSSIVATTEFQFDLKTKSFALTKDQIREQMLTADGISYESSYQWFRSIDGTEVPVRITYRKDLKLDGSHPVLMDVYGGFSKAAQFYPSFNAVNLDFLARGGIIADPALRGGNEFGDDWSKAATKADKVKTVEDLISSSRYLVKQGFTTPKKVIINGASNGGFVVAAAALKSPQDFGLVITLAGVHDMLHKEDLQFGLGRNGWIPEYGDSRSPKDYPYLAALSPVELATTPGEKPKFLVLTGRDDSRVDPANSYKLTTGLQDSSPQQVTQYSINNSGHYMTSHLYQGLIGWRAQVAIWTTIYDLIGWRR